MFFMGVLWIDEGYAQNATPKTTKPKVEARGSEKVVEQEEIDTIWGLAYYLGKKLANEMGNRMNLDESEPQPKSHSKKVKINIGPINIERIERAQES